MAKTNKALDWAKICAESRSASSMMPKEFMDRAKAFMAEVDAVNELQKIITRREADLEVIRVNFWHDVRKSLETKGIVGAFEKTGIDFDADALKDGFYVVNLFDSKFGPPMRAPRKA